MAKNPPVGELAPAAQLARRQWRYDAISTVTGVFLALFMWGHMMFVSSSWTGEIGFDWIAEWMEATWIAQITVVVVTVAFFLHFVLASRKIPAKLQERKLIKKLGDGIRDSKWRISAQQRKELDKVPAHSETSLWIWQVRTGMIILVIGAIHIFLVGVDVLQKIMGGVGIHAAESHERMQAGMWVLYVVLLVCVEFHAWIGVYRVFVKWCLGLRLPLIGTSITRKVAHNAAIVVLWVFIGVGLVTMLVHLEVIEPPLAFLLAS